MTGDLQPYPAYKDSGVPWLGEVPADWEVQRLKRVCRLVYGDSLPQETRQSGDIAVHGSNGRVGEHTIANTLAPCLIIGRKGSFGKVNYSQAPVFAIDTTFYIDQHSTNANLRWLYYLLTWIRLDSVSKDSAVPGLDREEAYQEPLPVPPLSEQAAIVRYLDYVDRRIRRSIRAKQKLIALLNEEKQAIIHQAVTRGLDPNVRLKPSGVVWLGDVPEHWEVRRLKFLAHIKTGGRDTVHRKDDGAYPFFVRSQTVERIDSYSFDGEAVLTAGDGAGVAKVFHYINGKFDYHQRVYKFSSFRKVHGRFFFYYFSCTLRFEAFRETAKSTVDSLRLPMLQNFPVPLPPIEEQDEIVMAVERQTQELDRSLATIRREISLLREYHTSLTADVVTGKLDVRDAATALPEEDEAPEALEEAPDEAEEGDESVPEEGEAET